MYISQSKIHITALPFAARIDEKKTEQQNMCGIHFVGIAIICLRYGVVVSFFRNTDPHLYP